MLDVMTSVFDSSSSYVFCSVSIMFPYLSQSLFWETKDYVDCTSVIEQIMGCLFGTLICEKQRIEVKNTVCCDLCRIGTEARCYKECHDFNHDIAPAKLWKEDS